MKGFSHISISLVAMMAVCLSCGHVERPVQNEVMREGGQIFPSVDTTIFLNGLQLFQLEEYDKARSQFLKSSESENIYIKAESFLYLNALEMQLQNYDTARFYLEKYHGEAIKLYQKALETENMIRSHREEIDRSMEQLNRKHNRLFTVIIALLIVAATVLFLIRHRPGDRVKIPGNLPGQRQNTIGPTTPIDASSFKRHLINAEIFKQTSIYSEITELANQKRDKNTRVLTSNRQKILDEKLSEVFSEFIAELHGGYNALTTNDIKLCCLSLLPLSSFGKALCFGSTETNIVKQRKHHIKKKMGINSEGIELFGFIFAPRENSARQDADNAFSA